MANQYKKTITLGLDYSEFSGGISECNRKMGLLDAEMKLAAEKAKGFGDATDQLRIKQEGLSQKIELQKKIVEQEAEAYRKASEEEKKSEKILDALQKSYINAQTKLKRLENALKSTTEELEDMGKESEEAAESVEQSEEKTASFGDVIREVADYLNASGNPIVEKLAEHFDGLNNKLAFAALKASALVGSFAALTISTSEHAKEVDTASQKIGMTTDQYQEWDYILKTVDSSLVNASGDFASLAEKALDAAQGGEEYSKTFRILGVNLKDSNGQLKTQGELFTDVVSGLRNLNDETYRNATASDLLGQTGEDLIPILNMTRQELENLSQTAHDTGNVMDKETLEKFVGLNDNMKEFKTVIDGLAAKGAEVLLPLLSGLFEALSIIPVPVLQGIAAALATVGTLRAIFGIGQDLSKGFKEAKDTFKDFNPTAMKTKALVLGVAGAVLLLLGAVAVLSNKGNTFKEMISEVGHTVSQIQTTTNKVPYNARGTKYFEGGQTWVGEEGPELVTLPRGSRIASHRESVKAVGGKTGNTYIFNIQADKVEDFARLVKLAEEERIAFRAGRVRI